MTCIPNGSIILTVLAIRSVMDYQTLQEEIKNIFKTDNWRKLMGLIDNGSKGMFLILRILSDNEGEIVAGDLAKCACVSTARIASALNTLEKKGFVKREKSAMDARKVVIHMTDEGRKVMQERLNVINSVVIPMFERLTEEETETMIELIKKFLS